MPLFKQQQQAHEVPCSVRSCCLFWLLRPRRSPSPPQRTASRRLSPSPAFQRHGFGGGVCIPLMSAFIVFLGCVSFLLMCLGCSCSLDECLAHSFRFFWKTFKHSSCDSRVAVASGSPALSPPSCSRLSRMSCGALGVGCVPRHLSRWCPGWGAARTLRGAGCVGRLPVTGCRG